LETGAPSIGGVPSHRGGHGFVVETVDDVVQEVAVSKALIM